MKPAQKLVATTDMDRGLKRNDHVVANHSGDWHRLKSMVLDSVSSLITRRMYNLGLDEFIEWSDRSTGRA